MAEQRWKRGDSFVSSIFRAIEGNGIIRASRKERTLALIGGPPITLSENDVDQQLAWNRAPLYDRNKGTSS